MTGWWWGKDSCQPESTKLIIYKIHTQANHICKPFIHSHSSYAVDGITYPHIPYTLHPPVQVKPSQYQNNSKVLHERIKALEQPLQKTINGNKVDWIDLQAKTLWTNVSGRWCCRATLTICSRVELLLWRMIKTKRKRRHRFIHCYDKELLITDWALEKERMTPKEM